MATKLHPLFNEILQTAQLITRCPACTYTGGHAANCQTQLATPEQRIRRAARLFDSYVGERAVRECRTEGISETEAAVGIKLMRAQRNHRSGIYSKYGRPEYGSYTVRDADKQRGIDAEREIIDSYLSTLVERKGPSFEQLSLEEQLVASIAVVNHRKGKVA